MAHNPHPDGLHGTGDVVVSGKPFHGLDNCLTWYVHFATGVDAVAPAGRDRQKPLKTLLQAVTNASTADVIVLMDGHEENLAAAMTINKVGLVITGSGRTDGVPNVKIGNAGTGVMFNIQAASIELRNIHILSNSAPNANVRIGLGSAVGFVMDSCLVDCGPNDTATAGAISFGQTPTYTTIRNTTFVSTATSPTARPPVAVFANTGDVVTSPRLSNVTFDCGEHGFSSGYAMDLASAGGVLNIKAEHINLLRGASVRLGALNTGYFIIDTAHGGAVVEY